MRWKKIVLVTWLLLWHTSMWLLSVYLNRKLSHVACFYFKIPTRKIKFVRLPLEIFSSCIIVVIKTRRSSLQITKYSVESGKYKSNQVLFVLYIIVLPFNLACDRCCQESINLIGVFSSTRGKRRRKGMVWSGFIVRGWEVQYKYLSIFEYCLSLDHRTITFTKTFVTINKINICLSFCTFFQ